MISGKLQRRFVVATMFPYIIRIFPRPSIRIPFSNEFEPYPPWGPCGCGNPAGPRWTTHGHV